MSEEALGHHVVARCASDCAPHGAGKIVGWCDAPTYLIQRPDGSQFSWRVDLCQVVDDGQVGYKERSIT